MRQAGDNPPYDFLEVFGWKSEPAWGADSRLNMNYGKLGGYEDLKSVIFLDTVPDGGYGPYFHELGHAWNVKFDPSFLLQTDNNISSGHWGFTILDAYGQLGGWAWWEVWCRNKKNNWVLVHPDHTACHPKKWWSF
eukprot:UN33670